MGHARRMSKGLGHFTPNWLTRSLAGVAAMACIKNNNGGWAGGDEVREKGGDPEQGAPCVAVSKRK